MTNIFTGLFIGLSVFLIIGCSKSDETHSQPPELSYDQLFVNPEKTLYTVSQDGSKLAYVIKNDQKDVAVYKELDRIDSVKISVSTIRQINSLRWKGNGSLLGIGKDVATNKPRVFIIETDSAAQKGYTFHINGELKILDLHSHDPSSILVSFIKNARHTDVYKLDLLTGVYQKLNGTISNVNNWQIDSHGKLKYGVYRSDSFSQLLKFSNNLSIIDTIYTWQFPDLFEPLNVSKRDTNSLYVLSNINRDKSALVIFDVVDKQENKVLSQMEFYDVSLVQFSEQNKTPISVCYYNEKLNTQFLNVRLKKASSVLLNQFQENQFELVSTDKQFAKSIYKVTGDRQLEEYYLYQSKNNTLIKLSNNNWKLPIDFLSEQLAINFTSRDGIDLTGYLTLPVGVKKSHLPVIIIPRANPWDRHYWRYNPIVQYLANRGYAVFQINCRGGSSFGKGFFRASFKQWGRNMQNDISDGIRYLVKQGTVDQNRIGIYGSEYGGYAALAGVTYTPDLYSCAVSVNPIISLTALKNSKLKFIKENLVYLSMLVGDVNTDKEMLERYSPSIHPEQIKTSLLIINDTTASQRNTNEVNKFVKDLRWERVDVTYLPLKKNAGSPDSKEMREIETFLHKHLLSEE